MKKSSTIFLLFSLILLTSGCATIFKGTSEEVNFNTDPQRAEVWINGVNMGETPVSFKLESKKTYTIEFKKPGYKTSVYKISNHVGAGWVILDVLAGVFGVVIDAVTGAWYKLDQTNVNAILEKQQP